MANLEGAQREEGVRSDVPPCLGITMIWGSPHEIFSRRKTGVRLEVGGIITCPGGEKVQITAIKPGEPPTVTIQKIDPSEALGRRSFCVRRKNI